MRRRMRAVRVTRLATVIDQTLVGLISRYNADFLSIRQLGVFLRCYLQPNEQTVRGLEAALGIPGPSIVRALNHLEKLEFIERKADPSDGRSILLGRTLKGETFMRDFLKIVHDIAIRMV